MRSLQGRRTAHRKLRGADSGGDSEEAAQAHTSGERATGPASRPVPSLVHSLPLSVGPTGSVILQNFSKFPSCAPTLTFPTRVLNPRTKRDGCQPSFSPTPWQGRFGHCACVMPRRRRERVGRWRQTLGNQTGSCEATAGVPSPETLPGPWAEWGLPAAHSPHLVWGRTTDERAPAATN